MMAMKTKTFLVGSLTVNAIVLGALIFLLKTSLALPDYLPASVRYVFVTNVPPAVVEQSTNAGALPSP